MILFLFDYLFVCLFFLEVTFTELQHSVEAEKNAAYEETRRKFDEELAAAVKEAKLKQWVRDLFSFWFVFLLLKFLCIFCFSALIAVKKRCFIVAGILLIAIIHASNAIGRNIRRPALK